MEHGGNIDAAIARHGGAAEDWIDLSTGINRRPWPVPPASDAALRGLPTAALTARAIAAARRAWDTAAPGLPLAGAQAGIQLAPRLARPGRVRILGPTYNEHAHAFGAAGWTVEEVQDAAALAGADAAVVVNPNNPTGTRLEPEALAALAGEVGLLVVDESFADPEPGVSLCPRLPLSNALVLRSFGKFFGLAGLRLGFAFGSEATIEALAGMAGPWAVNGPALEAGAAALADLAWQEGTRARLAAEAGRLDRLADGAGWRGLGGTPLFRLYDTGDGAAAQAALAGRRIWSRRFSYAPSWLRLGMPGDEGEWARLEAALSGRDG